MNNEQHAAQHAAWERGYGEALLDLYCFLTANEQVFDIEPIHLASIRAMVAQVNDTNVGGLRLVEEEILVP